jgi:6-phosphogluconolactonase
VESSINIFPTPFELAERFAEELVSMIRESENEGRIFTLALSGGSTPGLLFSVLGDHFSRSVSWKRVHLFWGDERCVPPEDIESNYGMAKKKLLEKIDLPLANIHRIRGEENPISEAARYSEEIKLFTQNRAGFPVFDMVILGLGDDGHTASIFPGNTELLTSQNVCEIAQHPKTFQRRITITCRVINNSQKVAFLVTGSNKAEIVEGIINKRASAKNFPASYIVPVDGKLSWFIDKEAARLL